MPAPTSDDVALYLAEAGATSWRDEEIAAVLDAEKASQARACIVPADNAEWPPDLTAALMRRVARALAMRKAPLGIAVNEIDSVRVPGRDHEVARLEAPHRRLVVA